jgi:hypothetical protein
MIHHTQNRDRRHLTRTFLAPDIKHMMTHETETQVEALSDSVTHRLEECPMVLPGIQVLFGFQLVAVFNSTFWTKLDCLEQVFHYVAL